MAGVRVLFAGYQRDSDKELTLAVKNIRNAGATLDVQVETPSRFLLGPKAPSAHRTTVTNDTTHVIVSRRFSIKPWTQQSLVSDSLTLGDFWSLGPGKISPGYARTGRLTRSFCTCRLLWVIVTRWERVKPRGTPMTARARILPAGPLLPAGSSQHCNLM